MTRTLLLLTLACPTAVVAQSEVPRSAGLAFEAVEGTGLPELLVQRRERLEKAKGEPLKGHEWWLWGLGSFDYDRDGDTDLIVCVHGGRTGAILRNQLAETGRLTFVDATAELGVDGVMPATDNYPLVWDFDGDGDLDIAGLFDDTTTACLINEEGKRFAKADFSLHPINYPEAVRDLNGDGYVDIVQRRRGRQVQFLYDPKGATFRKTMSSVDPFDGLPDDLRRTLAERRAEPKNRFVRFTTFRPDLNGDGADDLVVRAFGSYGGDRRGWYRLTAANGDADDVAGLPAEGAPLLIDDLDRDGDLDLLLASGKEAGLFLNDGRARFTRQPGPLTDFVARSCPYLHVVWQVDFDRDGDRDIAVSNRRYGQVRIFENRGAGAFEPVLSVRGWDADPVVLRDVDGDGLVDVVVGGARGKEDIGIYRNVTPRPGNGCRLALRMPGPNRFAIGTRVEVFPADTLGRDDTPPLLDELAHTDGTPIPIGLGPATSFDLRITFPGQEPIAHRNVTARPELVVTPEGITEATE